MSNDGTNFIALQEIADLSTEGVIIYDLLEKKLVYSNTVAINLLGLHEGARQGDIEAIFARVASEDKAYIRKQYSSVSSKSITAEVEFRLIGTSKDDIFICCNAYLIANKTAIVVYIRDITKAKEHESYLVEFGARKNTLLDTLTHNISGALHLMRHLWTEADKHVTDASNKNLRIYLNLIGDNNKKCLEIIDDLLINEHEQSPGVFVKTSKIDIIDRVAIIHDELQRSFQNRKFIFEHTTDSLFITTDAVKLLQVVNNLTSNAIKFSPDETPIHIKVFETADEVIVSVVDRGVGIPASLQPHVFDRQVGTGRTGLKGEKSHGIGLSICKNLIEMMYGKMWFESKEHEGSSFYFSLPKEPVH